MKVSTIQNTSNVTNLGDIIRYVSQQVASIITVINGNISFNDNMDVYLLSVSFPKALTNSPFSHGLGRTPTNFIIMSPSANANIWQGGSANTSDKIFLSSSGAINAEVLLF